MTAPENSPARGPSGPGRGHLATTLLWVATLGLCWPVWLWRAYRTLHPRASRLSPGRAAGLAAVPGLNLAWTALLAVDLPRAVRRARTRRGDRDVPDTELLTILLIAPLAAGVALAIVVGLSPLLVVLLAGYLAWPFELPAALATERALGDLRPEWDARRRRRDIAGALAVGAVAVAALAVVIATGGDDGTKPAPTGPPPFSSVSDIAVANDALWITHTASGTVSKLDPRTREPLAPPLRVGRQTIDIGAREDGVWVANFESGTVIRIDPEANQLTGPIETGEGAFGIAVTPDAVWVTNQVDATVTRIDPDTNRPGRPVRVGRDPRGVAVGEGAVWVATGEGKGVSRIDPSRGARRAREIRIGRSCQDVAVAGGYVWATNPNDSTVTRVDPGTNRRVGRPIAVAPSPTTIELGFGSLWVAGAKGHVTRIDPRTGKPDGPPLTLGTSVADLTVGDDAVWVLLGDGNVRRLPPPR